MKIFLEYKQKNRQFGDFLVRYRGKVIWGKYSLYYFMKILENIFKYVKSLINYQLVRLFLLVVVVFIFAISITAGHLSLSAPKPQDVVQAAVVPLEQTKVRVLIVPGHEPGSGGAEFGKVEENELAVELGQDLQKLLEADGSYEVFITRDNQDWNPIFSNYFTDNWDDIAAWEKLARQTMEYLISVGSMTKPTPTIIHNNAPKNVALRLYGITKWSNENNMDVMVHIHFNDYSGHRWNRAGKYSGFAIYVPAPQYYNGAVSRAIAQDVLARLLEKYKVSNFSLEKSGIIDEPGLIAVGENNTSNAASILIEYGYIYETKFVDPKLRPQTLQAMAGQTFLGLQDYFDLASAKTSQK